MASEGWYLAARHDLTVLLERLPTIEEIADFMEVSTRTVVAIRAGMRTWQREAADALGWDPPTALHPLDGVASPRAAILGAYAAGDLTTGEAVARLGLAGLPADPSNLRKWRSRLQQPE
jgi:hypothetical protein